MSDGNRGLLASLAGLAALLCASGFGAFYGSVYAPDKNHYDAVAANGGQTYPSDSPRNGLENVRGIDSLTQSAIAKPKPRNTEEREQRDLAAQESMAVFAYWMFGAVVLQTLFAGGAFIALLQDLKQNRESAQAQLRAYLCLDEFVWETSKSDYKMQIQWTNCGQTPAYAVDAYANFIVRTEPIPPDFAFPRPEIRVEDGTATIGPQKSVFGTCPRELDQQLLSYAANGSHHIYIWGRTDYRDSFGKTHFTETAAKLDVERLSNGQLVIRWGTVPRHNDAT